MFKAENKVETPSKDTKNEGGFISTLESKEFSPLKIDNTVKPQLFSLK